MSWTDASGGPKKAYLNERVNGGAWAQTAVTGTTSKAYTGKAVASYGYKLQIYVYDGELKKYLFEYETPVVTVQVWKSIPAAPGAISGPHSVMPGASFALSWPAPPGAVTRYEVYEGAQRLAPDPTSPSITIPGRASGQYQYKARACNGLGCGPYGATFTVDVDANLTLMVDDAAFAPDAPLPQGWVGRLPGKATTDGGAANYRIDVEVPPGRQGMQPQVSLGYGSRSGSGLLGVGWSLSAGGSVYRCPRTLESDGGNRPVLLDSGDRLCLDGQRLVQVPGGTFGDANTEYRTEIDQFARIKILGGDFGSASSYFQVERKDGRVEHYTPQLVNGQLVPDTWRLAREFDRQGNCISYQYGSLSVPGGGQEVLLTSIAYTGTTDPATGTVCTVDAGGRAVTFGYTWDREDKRTTYRAGYASHAHARLATITTSVGGAAARRLVLTYGDAPSRATRRSLLRSVQWCAGAGCGAGSLPPTTFTYGDEPLSHGALERVADPDAPASLLGATWYAGVDGDFDGDGTRDQVFASYTNPPSTRSSKMELSSGRAIRQPGGGASTSVPTDWVLPAPLQRSWGLSSTPPSLDVDMDGRADLVAGHGGRIYSGSLRPDADPAFVNWVWTDLGLTGDTAYPRDFDGDGRVDLMVYSTTGSDFARNIGNGSSDPVFDTSEVRGPPLCSYSPHLSCDDERDFNGDGTLDRWNNQIDSFPGDSKLTFFRGFGTVSEAEVSIGSLGGPAGDFGHTPGRTWIDLNGDGLSDIWEPGKVYLNRGSAFGQAPTFAAITVSAIKGLDAAGKLVPITLTSLEQRRLKFAMAVDYDSDGIEELMVPAVRVAWYCGREPASYPTWPPDVPHTWCGDEFDDLEANDSLDRSVFTWDAFKVIPDGAGAYMMVRIPTTYTARVGSDPVGNTAPVDLNGDGLTDAAFTLFERSMATSNNQTIHFGWYEAGTALGPYRVIAKGTAPDLIKQVADGLGASASWKHRPLSRKEEEVTGVDPPDDPACDWTPPFYVAHNDDLPQADRDAGNVLFTSSMWAAASMRTSNAVAGAASATNLTCYRYEDAMLNVRGRGFMGFKKIVAEERLLRAQGELDPGGAAAKCGSGKSDFCSVNNLRTTTDFNQGFPFTNTPQRVTVEAVGDGRRLAETTSWWHAVQEASGKPWVRYQTAGTERKFDPATGALLSTTTSVTELDLVSGEATRTCTISSDDGMASVYSGLPASVTPSLTTFSQETRVLINDQDGWWLGRLDSSTTLVGAYTGSADFVAQRVPTRKPGTKASAEHSDSPETCPSPPAASRQVTTAFSWWPDSAVSIKRRKLATQLVTPAGATEPETETTFDYGAYGNPLTKTVQARAVLDGASNRVLHTTTFGASADGYFVETEVNPLGHVATTRRDAATGQVIYQQEVLGGPTVTTTLDTLGRPLTVSKDGAKPVNQRTVACSALLLSSAVACEPLEVMARQTTQAGAPARAEYLDRLGRVLRTATVAMNGSILLTEVVYNERGLKVMEFAPRVAGAPEFPTVYSGFDRLGRPTQKEVHRSEGIFDGGADTRPLKTTYAYAGHTTEIVADEGGPVPLSMSRSYDAKGRLVRTVQQIAGRNLAVQYVYDPSGGLTHIVDQAGQFIAAEYDALGRKTRVADPDRGTWTYVWDGLGRLLSQTDARGRLTTRIYDALGRPVHQQAEIDGGTPATASWVYDLPGQEGLLGREEDSDGFFREYQYDSLRRPTRVTTKIPATDSVKTDGEPWVFTMDYGYDRVLGRLKATRYPSAVSALGETVALDYDARGYLLGEVGLDGSYARTKAYRKVLGMSERGQVTEQRLGNCVRETGEYDPSTGAARVLTATRPGTPPATLPTTDLAACPGEAQTQALVRQDVYWFDRFMNLKRQTKNVAGAHREERFTYDALQRLTRAALCTGADCTPTTEVVDYEYDDLGNLTKKTDYGTSYLYGTVTWDANSDPDRPRWVRGTGNAGPHAVHKVTKSAAAGGGEANFTYDANGNLTDGDGRRIEYDLMDRPVRVKMGGAEMEFAYGPAGGRYRQKVTATPEARFGPKTVYYVDKDYELTVWDTDSAQPGVLEERTFIGPSVTVLTRTTAAGTQTRSVRYRHVDRLGSPDADTAEDVGATLVEAHGFDAWGKPRTGQRKFDSQGRLEKEMWASDGDQLHPGGEPGTASTRGFTGHEHLDATYLIHMNGRVYDYRLGRFLSVDPIISNPLSSQAINPYSYIGNNPLSGTDPTGYDACPAGQKASDGGCQAPSTPTKDSPTGVSSAKGARSCLGGTPSEPRAVPAMLLAAQSNSGAEGTAPKSDTSGITDKGGPASTAKAGAEQPAIELKVSAGLGKRAGYQLGPLEASWGAAAKVTSSVNTDGTGTTEVSGSIGASAGPVTAPKIEVKTEIVDKNGGLHLQWPTASIGPPGLSDGPYKSTADTNGFTLGFEAYPGAADPIRACGG